jgi:hypothetical protein
MTDAERVESLAYLEEVRRLAWIRYQVEFAKNPENKYRLDMFGNQTTLLVGYFYDCEDRPNLHDKFYAHVEESMRSGISPEQFVAKAVERGWDRDLLRFGF